MLSCRVPNRPGIVELRTDLLRRAAEFRGDPAPPAPPSPSRRAQGPAAARALRAAAAFVLRPLARLLPRAGRRHRRADEPGASPKR